MSPVHNPYVVPVGLEDEEDGQEMEASPTNSNEEAQMEDLDTTCGEQQSDPTSEVLQGVRDEETINFKDDRLFMMPPSFMHVGGLWLQ